MRLPLSSFCLSRGSFPPSQKGASQPNTRPERFVRLVGQHYGRLVGEGQWGIDLANGAVCPGNWSERRNGAPNSCLSKRAPVARSSIAFGRSRQASLMALFQAHHTLSYLSFQPIEPLRFLGSARPGKPVWPAASPPGAPKGPQCKCAPPWSCGQLFGPLICSRCWSVGGGPALRAQFHSPRPNLSPPPRPGRRLAAGGSPSAAVPAPVQWGPLERTKAQTKSPPREREYTKVTEAIRAQPLGNGRWSCLVLVGRARSLARQVFVEQKARERRPLPLGCAPTSVLQLYHSSPAMKIPKIQLTSQQEPAEQQTAPASCVCSPLGSPVVWHLVHHLPSLMIIVIALAHVCCSCFSQPFACCSSLPSSSLEAFILGPLQQL